MCADPHTRYIDPAGFDLTEKGFANCHAGTIGRQFGEGFITGDAITAANVHLTILAETAFTNVLFVAMPGEAAANGDYLLMALAHERDRGAARARPPLRVVEQPCGRGRRDRHVHRVRHQGPRVLRVRAEGGGRRAPAAAAVVGAVRQGAPPFERSRARMETLLEEIIGLDAPKEVAE
jgi:hypothetical protein